MPPTPAEPPSGPGFVETSEIQFEFSNGDDEAAGTDQPDRSESDVEGAEPADQATAAPPRDHRATRVDREIPALSQSPTPTDSDGSGGNA